MQRRKPFVPALVSAVVLAAGATPVASAQSSEEPPWSFVTCTSGTPSGFTAVHTASNGAAFRLAGGTSDFVVPIFVDVTAGRQFHRQDTTPAAP
jgi:hypothetical protein